MNRLFCKSVFIILILASSQSFSEERGLISKSSHAGDNIYQVVYSESNKKLYVAVAGNSNGQGEVAVFDGINLQKKMSIIMPARPLGLAIDQKDGLLFSSNNFQGSITKVDINTGKVVDTLVLSPSAPKGTKREDMPPKVHSIIYDPQIGKLFITGAGKDGVLWKVDAKTFQLEDTIKHVGGVPTGMALDSKAQKLYIAIHDEKSIAILNTNTDKIEKHLNVGNNPMSVDIGRYGKYAYIANSKDNNFYVVDIKENEVISKVKTGDFPLDIKIDSNGGNIFVANRGDGTVQKFDSKTYQLKATYYPGIHPNTLSINHADNKVYVTSKGLSRRESSKEIEIVNPSADVISSLDN